MIHSFDIFLHLHAHTNTISKPFLLLDESDSSAEIRLAVCVAVRSYAVYLHARLHATLNLAASLSSLSHSSSSAACVGPPRPFIRAGAAPPQGWISIR